MDQSQNNTEIGIFKILMLGKRRWSSNIRILCVYDKEISYYGIPKEKKETLNFLSKFNAFYEKPGGNLSNQDINSLEFIQLGKAFAEIQDICECKGGIKIEEMEIVQFSTTEAKDPQINPKNYLYPILIKQKADNNDNTLELYKQAQDKNSKNNGKDKKNSNSNNWLLDFYDKGNFEKFVSEYI
jgi:hypothetical protein